ncbi:hypothetical protein C8N24_5635 [Solirubrobacter pauli]|uniref:Dolichyl-phosphate-mannose-protein mannosyltransferase n=1 Tax=Solirubrobacter pauli TaxID=166793 RepID=A0A660L7R2_9ACTN|nr:hypothetical protein C8N24_5635 [Solirubrobacter pauli]
MAVVLAAFALAALSLLLPWALAFDPLAWLVWGRETERLALDTTTGPSWKPFPVLFTVVFALWEQAAPALWLIVARAGGLLAWAGAYVLGARLAGRWAGAAAVAAVALSPWWLFNTALGNSEGLLAAAVLWAVIAHLDGRARAALAFGTAAALMRPEAWPFLGLYGLWLWRRDQDRGAVIAAGVVVPLLWFGPDLLGAGGALGASHTARGVPSPGSAKLADVPFFAVLSDTATISTLPAVLAALVAAVLGGPLARRIFAAAAAWVLLVAVMTVAGYAGNPRYLVAAAALGAALAGAGAVRAAGRAATARTGRRGRRAAGAGEPGTPAWAAPLGAVVLVALVLVVTGGTLRDQWTELGQRADAADALNPVIAEAGGRDRLVACSRIRTSARARSLVAWRLDLPMRDLDARAERPAVIIRSKWFYGQGLEPPDAPGYRPLVTTERWQVLADCGPAPQLNVSSGQ